MTQQRDASNPDQLSRTATSQAAGSLLASGSSLAVASSQLSGQPCCRWGRVLQRVVVGCLLLATLVFTPSSALAAKKKKEEEAPTKSYVLPYMIVMMMVSVGLMTVCRPGKRKDRPDDKKVEEE